MAEGLFGTSSPAPQLQQTRIQPAATPGSTFVRPQQVQTGGNLRALADSLGSLNNSITNYFQVKDQIENDPDSRANKEWIAKRQQMSLEELLNDPDQNTQIRVRQDAFDALLGERANTDFRLAWANFYETEFDRTSGDAAAEYERMREEFAERLPSEVARGNFYRLTGRHHEAALAADAQEKISYAKQQVNDTIVGSWHTQISDMMAAGETDPQKLADAVFASSASNRTFLGLSGQEQNATVWALAQRAALDGNTELVEALVNSPRKGADGKPIGPLSGIVEYQAKAAQLIQSSKGIASRNYQENNLDTHLELGRMVEQGTLTSDYLETLPPGAVNDGQKATLLMRSDANRERLVKAASDAAAKAERENMVAGARHEVLTESLGLISSGRAHLLVDKEVPNASGGTTTLTRQQQLSNAEAHMQSVWLAEEQRMVEADADPEQVKAAIRDAKLAWYEQANIVNKEWSEQFETLPLAANPNVIANSPEARAKFIETAELYRQIKADNPAYAEKLVDPKSREFLQHYSNAVERRMTPEQALELASTRTHMSPAEKARGGLSPAEKDTIIRRAMRSIGADAYGDSYAIMSSEVDSMIELGADPSSIRDRLQEWAEDSTYVVNGVVVPSVRDQPADFLPLVNLELEQVFEDNKEFLEGMGATSPSDLFIRPDPSENRWSVWIKGMNYPLGATYIDQESLDARRNAVHQERIDAADAAQADNQKKFDERVAYERARIDEWKRGPFQGVLIQKSIAAWERDLQEFIDSRDPVKVRAQREEQEAQRRLDIRMNSLRLGFPDPTPGEELPEDFMRELNATAISEGTKPPYPHLLP